MTEPVPVGSALSGQRSVNRVAALVRLAGLLSLAIGVVAPLQVVVMASRGLSPAVIGLVFGSFALVGSLAEVPAGVVADRLGYRFVLVGGAALMAGGVLLRVVLVEEGWRRERAPTTTSDVLAGLRSVATSPVLRLVAVRWLLVPVALAALHLVTPLRLTSTVGAGTAATLMGWLVAAAYLCHGVSSRVAPVLRARSGPWAPSVALTLAGGLVLALAGASASPAWVVVALTLLFVLSGPVGPLLGPTLHAAVPSGSRATVLSAASVVGNAGDLAGALLLGWVLGAAGAGWAYAIAGATMAAVAIPLLGLRRTDLASAEIDAG